jgi:membrane complex biogenesis BtpA family protein
VNVLCGARVTDQGVIEGEAARVLRKRRQLGADAVAIWADVDVKHSAPLAPYPLDQEVHDVIERGLASAVLVTGEGTGRAVDTEKLARVKRAAGTAPVIVASGATVNALEALSEHADGVIVGSALRADGRAGGPIDEARAAAFVKAFDGAFS